MGTGHGEASFVSAGVPGGSCNVPGDWGTVCYARCAIVSNGSTCDPSSGTSMSLDDASGVSLGTLMDGQKQCCILYSYDSVPVDIDGNPIGDHLVQGQEYTDGNMRVCSCADGVCSESIQTR
jgi:hypothetical protein